MATTSARPSHLPDQAPGLLNTDLKNVQEFFQYSLPKFKKDDDHIQSASTRPPAYFDRHLEEKLRLERVVYLPSLLGDLGAMADQALSNYLSKRTHLPTTTAQGNKFPGFDIREEKIKDSPHKKLQNESHVETTYLQTMARYCLIVASTLEFQLPVWSSGYLRWSTEHRSEENHAIADGFFKMVNEPSEDPIPPLPKTYLDMIKDFPVLGVWEFKSLRAGSLTVFEAIREHTREVQFPWVGCHAKNFCALHHPTEWDSTPRTWSKLGPDASRAVCKSVLSSSRETPPQPSQKLGKTEWTHGTHMYQQVWAEMVKHDTTFACLNAGRLEIYLHRDRAANTLYITDIIWTDTPGRARLLTGLFIAMIRDAEDRSSQLRKAYPQTWCDANPFSQPGIVALSSKQILREARNRQWLVLTQMKKHIKIPTFFWPESLYMRLHPPTVPADEIVPEFDEDSPFIRILLPPQRHAAKAVLLIEGNLLLEIQGRSSQFVWVKNANHPRTLERLAKEYVAYLRLKAADVTCIPELFGIFGHTNSEKKKLVQFVYLCLVLEDVGHKSVRDKWEKKRTISDELRQECVLAMMAIHAADLCYGDEISLDNIIIRPKSLRREGRLSVSFVGFGGAYETTEKALKDAEAKALIRRLRNPGKRPVYDADLDDPDDIPPQKYLNRLLGSA